jgi:diphthamide synthase (EF-2-diphthine--ammonia ligase)
MAKAIAEARGWGVTHVAFGDLFLEDVRRYREERLAGTGIDPLFPLWGKPTDKLSREMLASGLRAVVTCADPSKIPGDLAGRWYDDAFLNALPEGVDPCGENGEFHTCVLDAPGFAIPVRAKIGEAVERDGFRFVDVVLEG